MSTHFLWRARSGRNRAVVAVQVAVCLVAVLGFAALTIDVGAIYNARADLQRTADAAALAAASQLAEYGEGDPIELATAAALEYTQSNRVLGQSVTMDVATDIEFGRATYNTATNQYSFVPNAPLPDAVKVRIRKTANSPNKSLTLYFARVFGISKTDLSAEALAVMVPRDIAIVADLSGSHNDDSELRHYQMTEVNLYDVWDSFSGGVGDVGAGWDIEDLPAGWIEEDGSAPQAAGPAWGYMQELGYGTMDLDVAYDPTADPGLVRLAYTEDWTDAQLESHLYERGYIPSEVDAIMRSTYDADGGYKYRVAVALGLAFWNSGHPGGLWQQRGVDPATTGNGNGWIGGSELEWTETILGRSLSTSKSLWLDYIDNYTAETWTQMYRANSDFQYRFGVKTFINYLLERKATHAQTPEMAEVPTQPMQAVKDAVHFMVDLIDDLDTDDQISLEVYGTTGRHEVDLTPVHREVSDRLNELQAGHYDTWTNTGGGLERAVEELTGPRARGMSRKMIILLTDGNANVNAEGQVGDFTGGTAYALSQAEMASSHGMRVFAVSVGAGANQSLMQQVAEIADGEHFHAEGSIAQYSQQLAEIFQRLGNKRPVELIR